MKNYLFCAGGCGARVLEAVVHLCAPGLGPDEIKVLIIDPDASGGNLGLTNLIINSYNACQSFFGGGNLGKEDFFKTKLTLLAGGGGGATGAWSPVLPRQQFKDVLGYESLGPQEKSVADLLFTKDEREMYMNLGFLGHPSIGAAALSLLPLFQNNPPWSNPNSNNPGIIQQLNSDLSQGPVRVVIAGSVFGGTGASTFFPLALWLHSVKAAASTPNQLEVGVVAMSPYFVFPPAPAAAAPKPGPDARKFPLATRAAAHFYDQMRTLGNWPFTGMFWLGDDTPTVLPRFEGGSDQKNPPHFLELLAAQAALDFFDAAPGGGDCYYSGTADKSAPSTISWTDIPRLNLNADSVSRLRKQVLKFLLCGLMHTDFYWPMFRDAQGSHPIRPEAIPWYNNNFARRGKKLGDAPHSNAMGMLDDFNNRHVNWWDGLHHTTPDRVHLLNMNAFVSKPAWNDPKIQRICLDNTRMRNLQYGDDPKKHAEGETEFHKLMFADIPAGAADGAPAYLALLAQASTRFLDKHYKSQ